MTIELLMFNCRGGIGLENRHSERVLGSGGACLAPTGTEWRTQGSTPSPSTVLWLPSLKVRTSAFQAEDAGFKLCVLLRSVQSRRPQDVLHPAGVTMGR